jgi:hypothetical protein
MLQDVKTAVIAPNLKVSMVRIEPAVKHLGYNDTAISEIEGAWRFLAPISGVTFDPRAHVSPRPFPDSFHDLINDENRIYWPPRWG